MPAHELTSVEEFRYWVARDDGVILITDRTNPSRIHKGRCRYVQERNFKEKVIARKNRSGRYYWASSVKDAQEVVPEAGRCYACDP